MKKVAVFLLALTLAACLIAACNQRPNSAPPGENCSLPGMAGGELCPEEALLDDTAHEAAETPPQDEFVSFVQIHEDMPAFTITWIVGDFVCASLERAIPSPVEVRIIIEDGENNVIQTITGLSISNGFFASDLSFDDYNFDGYLDMRLMRWQDGAGGRLASEYFWLWNRETEQFEPCKQLTELEQAGLIARQEARQIAVWQRAGNFGKELIYEYSDGELLKVIAPKNQFCKNLVL